MSQDTERNITTRRAVLSGAAPAVAAMALTGSALAAVTPAEDDPAIAVVNEWYAAAAAYTDVLYNSDEGGGGPKTTKAFKANNKAEAALFNVSPTTFVGAVALLEAIASYDCEDGEPRELSPLEWWVNGDDEMAAAVNDTLLEIVEVLRKEVRA
jgi:hypothetical protein